MADQTTLAALLTAADTAYADLAVKALPVAYFGAGTHRHMLRLPPIDLERLSQVEWADLTTALT